MAPGFAAVALPAAGRLSKTLGGMVNCPAPAFSTQKNVTAGAAGSFGADTPRISTSPPASTPDQLTVTPWPRCTLPTAKRLSNLGGAVTAIWALNAPIG